MKIARIEYTIREDIALDEVEAAIATFVAGIRAHDAGHDYTSYRNAGAPRQFVHIGRMRSDRLADLQAQPFFGEFSSFLRDRCERGPEVTWLAEVASTR
jgi:hypothetical protein